MKWFFITALVIFSPFVASASTAVLEIDTGRETINALEAILEVPRDITIEDIHIGNSSILIWITEPVLDVETNTISFAGFTPGGFRGEYPILYIVGEFKQSDLSRVRFNDVKALINDGLGTKVSVMLDLKISEIIDDTIPPEPFELVISSSPDVFENKHFISFIAQDKGTGVDRYEYASTWLFSPREKSWNSAKSPLVLSRIEVFKRIHIRAIDKTDNYQEVSTAGPYHYATLSIGIIILLCVILLLRLFVWPRS